MTQYYVVAPGGARQSVIENAVKIPEGRYSEGEHGFPGFLADESWIIYTVVLE